MQFSIITPSFRSSEWLKLCIASVADQEVEHEHIVQDACSDDGTLDWLRQDPRVRAYIEKDAGMYDAVNRGLRRAQGEFLAYLNCDEQYLPGALRAVADFFAAHPAVEVVFADTVVVDPDGAYLCHRRALPPARYHTMVSGNLSVQTCSTFFRRRLLEEHQLYFDARLRALGDVRWVLDLLARGVRTACWPRFTSVFTSTGGNLSLQPRAQRETAEILATAPAWARWLRPAIIWRHRLQKLLTGHYHVSPFDYALYTRACPERRTVVHVAQPRGVYRPYQPAANPC